MTGEVALKACPFCGGAAEPEHLESGRWSVGCHDEGCIAYMSMLTFARRAEAVTAWNTRSPVCEDARELVESQKGARIDIRGIALVAIKRMKAAGESHEMCARWISEDVHAALAKALPSLPGGGK